MVLGVAGAGGGGGDLAGAQAASRGRLWLLALGYAVACQIPIYLMRSSRFTALELAQTLRYLPDLVVVLTLLAAVGTVRAQPRASRVARRRPGPDRGDVVDDCRRSWRAACIRQSTFLTSWRDNPTKAYLQTVRSSLAAAHAASAAPLLDQEVDPLIMQRVAWPENMASHMFALVPDRPEFASSTTELRMFDSAGRLVDAKVTWVRTIVPGPTPQCGYLTQPDQPVADAARWAAAARGLDCRDQLPRQQRRVDDHGRWTRVRW